MKLEEILEKYGDVLTEAQHQYLTDYLKTRDYSKTADNFGRNESSVRRSIKAIKRRYAPKSNRVAEHQSEDLQEGFVVERFTAEYDVDGNRKRHWIKGKRESADVYADLVANVKELTQELPQFKPTKYAKEPNPDLLAVYPLGDPHIGLLTYSPEVNQDWDLTIAEKVFMPLFANLVASAPHCKECLIVDLGDFWHYDGMDQRTMRSGHKVDADGRPSKMVMVGFRIILAMIRYALEMHEIVNVKIMPGNHDDLGAVFLRTALWHQFENEPRVNVDLSPAVFQYFNWGQNLIGIHHGDKCKMNQLPMIMAADEPQLWGATKFRKWLVGHFHHDSSTVLNGKELQGCHMETFRTIVAGEGYAHEAGYRAQQDGKVLILHKDYGEVERYTVNISQVR